MSCKTLIIDNCEIKGSTFESRVFDFGSRDISADTFIAKVHNRNHVFLRDLTATIVDNTVYFPISELENKDAGDYIIDYWATFNGIGTELIAKETFKISKTPCNCSGNGNPISYTLEIDSTSIAYDVSFSIVNIGGDSGSVGPKGDKGDKGDTGAQGEQGIQGLQGIQGEKGDKGEDGVDGYTPIKGVDYFDGAQGIQGIQGEKGDVGATGANGTNGTNGTSVVAIQATNEANALSLSTVNPNNIYYW